MAKETVVSVFDDHAEVVTINRKWINKLDKLVEECHAEEIESDEIGQAYEMDASMVRIPFFRNPRKYTAAQKKAGLARLAAGREAKAKAKAESKPKAKPRKKRGVAATK